MQIRLKHAHLGALAAVLMLWAAPAAQAFTLGGETASGGASAGFEAPKFDLEEQARNFRNGGSGSASGKTDFNTPVGTMQFGVQQRPSSSFGGFGSGSLGPGSRVNRMDFERMVTPENMR